MGSSTVPASAARVGTHSCLGSHNFPSTQKQISWGGEAMLSQEVVRPPLGGLALLGTQKAATQGVYETTAPARSFSPRQPRRRRRWMRERQESGSTGISGQANRLAHLGHGLALQLLDEGGEQGLARRGVAVAVHGAVDLPGEHTWRVLRARRPPLAHAQPLSPLDMSLPWDIRPAAGHERRRCVGSCFTAQNTV